MKIYFSGMKREEWVAPMPLRRREKERMRITDRNSSGSSRGDLLNGSTYRDDRA